MHTISLLIKGTVLEATVVLGERGFHQDDLLTDVITYAVGADAAAIVTVKAECEPGVQRWFTEIPAEPPFPVGTLLRYTMQKLDGEKPSFTEALDAYVAAAHAKIAKDRLERFSLTDTAPLSSTTGPRYVKVVSDHSVHSFVEIATGDIFMPAGWRAPAKHARGNIYSAQNGLEALDSTGYVRYLK